MTLRASSQSLLPTCSIIITGCPPSSALPPPYVCVCVAVASSSNPYIFHLLPPFPPPPSASPINLPHFKFSSLPLFFLIFPANMKYTRGSVVEVQIHEYGFESSFYRATVVSYSRRNGYKVRFHELLEENNRDQLTQFAEEEHIRPIPGQPPFHSFVAGDVVDAEDRDGWWVGRVIRRVSDMLLISFPDHQEEMVVEESCLRLHQDYVEDGEMWVYTKA